MPSPAVEHARTAQIPIDREIWLRMQAPAIARMSPLKRYRYRVRVRRSLDFEGQPYTWEICRSDRINAAVQADRGYDSEADARLAGEQALKRFLDVLPERASDP